MSKFNKLGQATRLLTVCGFTHSVIIYSLDSLTPKQSEAVNLEILCQTADWGKGLPPEKKRERSKSWGRWLTL